MKARVNLREAVAQRSRDIASAARERAERLAGTSGRPAAPPGWLVGALGLLPDGMRLLLRAALGDAGDDELLARHEHLRQVREDLRHREAALDAARADLDRGRHILDEGRRELEGRSREAERLLASARRAAAEAAIERRVPLTAVHFRPEESPRPLRGLVRLAANLRRYGQLTPVVVRPDGAGYALVTGYRRLAALRLAGAPHVLVRVVPDLDDRTAAALYVAENCLPDGITSKAVATLARQLGEGASPALRAVLAEVEADDEATVEEVYLEDLAEEARHHLAEGAGWMAALRPHWDELEPSDREPLVRLLSYFARVAARLPSPP